MRMAGRIDGKEWMGDVDVDEDLRDGLTDKKGGSWGVPMYGYATRPGGVAVLGAWVCECYDPSARVNQTINQSVRLVQHFERSQGRVDLTDVGSCEDAHFTGLGQGGLVAVLMPPSCVRQVLCISSAKGRRKYIAQEVGYGDRGGDCHLGIPVPTTGNGQARLVRHGGPEGGRGCD